MRFAYTCAVLFLFSALSTSPAWIYSQEKPTADQLATLKKEAIQLKNVLDEHLKKQSDHRLKIEMALEKQRTLKRNQVSAQKQITDSEKQIKPTEAAITKKAAEVQKGETAFKAATQAAAKAKGSKDEKKTAESLKQAMTQRDKLNSELKTVQQKLAGLKQTIEKSKKSLSTIPAELKKLDADLENLKKQGNPFDEQVAAARQSWLVKQQRYEQGLIAVGQMVSFSEKIAPIFATKCLACHNARTAKGRYNMETWFATMKGGESGSAIDNEDWELSNLLIQIEDGSMPKDADPLPKEQINLVRKWIETGARLEAGLDPKAPLITIMPKPVYPTPPEKYHTTIPVTAIAFSPDGKTLASSGYHEILFWNVTDGKLLRRISNVAERIYDLDFSSDGKLIVAAAGTPAQIG